MTYSGVLLSRRSCRVGLTQPLLVHRFYQISLSVAIQSSRFTHSPAEMVVFPYFRKSGSGVHHSSDSAELMDKEPEYVTRPRESVITAHCYWNPFLALSCITEAFQPLIAHQAHRGLEHREALYQHLLRAIVQHRVANRPDPFEPRMTIRRAKNYHRLCRPRQAIKRQMTNRFLKL